MTKRISFLGILFLLFLTSSSSNSLFNVQLLMPFDNQVLEVKRPSFQWQLDLTSVIRDKRISQRFIMTEKRSGQSRKEAIFSNQPIILLENYELNSTNFPSYQKDLIAGKEYVWQVIVHMNGLQVGGSDIFLFSIPQVTSPRNEYVALKNVPDGNPFFLDKKVLKISVKSKKRLSTNAILRSDRGKMDTIRLVEVINGEKNPAEFSDPQAEVRYFEYDLSSLKLKKGMYTLIWSPNKVENYSLTFIYKKNKK